MKVYFYQKDSSHHTVSFSHLSEVSYDETTVIFHFKNKDVHPIAYNQLHKYIFRVGDDTNKRTNDIHRFLITNQED